MKDKVLFHSNKKDSTCNEIKVNNDNDDEFTYLKELENRLKMNPSIVQELSAQFIKDTFIFSTQYWLNSWYPQSFIRWVCKTSFGRWRDIFSSSLWNAEIGFFREQFWWWELVDHSEFMRRKTRTICWFSTSSASFWRRGFWKISKRKCNSFVRVWWWSLPEIAVLLKGRIHRNRLPRI